MKAISIEQIDASLRKELYDRAWAQGKRAGKNEIIKEMRETFSTNEDILAKLPKPVSTKITRIQNKKAKLQSKLDEVNKELQYEKEAEQAPS